MDTAITNKNVQAWTADLAGGSQVTIRNSRLKAAFFALLMLVLLVCVLAFALVSGSGLLGKLAGWLGVIVCLYGIVVFVRRLLSPAPAVVVSSEGIALKTAKAGVVPWSQILDVHPITMNSNVFIEVVITEQEADRQAAARQQ